jgi:hypothetical protein
VALAEGGVGRAGERENALHVDGDGEVLGAHGGAEAVDEGGVGHGGLHLPAARLARVGLGAPRRDTVGQVSGRRGAVHRGRRRRGGGRPRGDGGSECEEEARHGGGGGRGERHACMTLERVREWRCVGSWWNAGSGQLSYTDTSPKCRTRIAIRIRYFDTSILFRYRIRGVSKIQYNKINYDTYPILCRYFIT